MTVTSTDPTPRWMRVRDAAIKRGADAYNARLPEADRALMASLPHWWGECIDQWSTAQLMLTEAGIDPGRGAQSGGDLDTRIAKHVLPKLTALDRIAEAHHKHVDQHGGTSGDCNECGWTWPCPTYTWATSDRDPLACWNPRDDDEDAAP